MSLQDFDHIAKEYDADFTYSTIGKAQRNQVYKFLNQTILNFKGKSILEVNAGTGEDAIYLAQKGAKVTATDVSPDMINEGVKKASIKNLSISFKTLDINNLQKDVEETYDVIFSNFGGLNCISPDDFKNFIDIAYQKLNPNGKLIMVIMPRFCMWEFMYFMVKLKWKKAVRRLSSNPVMANVEGKNVPTWYYSPNQIKKWKNNFSVEFIKPVGFFIPPSYLNPFFKTKTKVLCSLIKLENKIENSSFWAARADHYFVVLSKKIGDNF